MEVGRLAGQLWGDSDSRPDIDQRRGRGRIVKGKTPEAVLAEMGVRLDFVSGDHWRYIHRNLDDTDVYFVANPQPQEAETVCTFRVIGKRPELWWPETGRIEGVAVYGEKDGCVTMPLRLGPSGSVFVIFRPGKKAFDPIATVTRNGLPLAGEHVADIRRGSDGGLSIDAWQAGRYELKTASGRTYQAAAPSLPPPLEVHGPWQVCFAPNGRRRPSIKLDKLLSWSLHGEAGVKYFSGTATYLKPSRCRRR